MRDNPTQQIKTSQNTTDGGCGQHHSVGDARRDHAYLAAARERGFITLDEIMQLASGSPVDADEARHITQEVGIDLVGDRAAQPMTRGPISAPSRRWPECVLARTARRRGRH